MGARLTGLAGQRQRPAGAILAGGQSARLGGTPKGLLDVGGMRMIDRVAAALRPVVDDIVVVSNAPDAGEWLPETPVVRDVLTGGGSAAGIHAALVALRRDVLVLAWDLAFVSAGALTEMTRRREDGKTSDYPAAIVPSHANGMIEPLCALYGPACIEVIEAAWKSGDRSAHGIVNRVRGVVVPATAFAKHGGTARLFFNVNTPADLEHARRAAGGGVDDERASRT